MIISRRRFLLSSIHSLESLHRISPGFSQSDFLKQAFIGKLGKNPVGRCCGHLEQLPNVCIGNHIVLFQESFDFIPPQFIRGHIFCNIGSLSRFHQCFPNGRKHKLNVVISKGGFLLYMAYHLTPIITFHRSFINRNRVIK